MPKKQDKNNLKNNRFLKAMNIIPKDDAYHGNIRLLDIEWWYFDAVFTNGYSIHIGFRIYHIKKIGVLQTRVNIYKDGKEQSKSRKIDFFSGKITESDYPTIYLNKNPVVKFDKQHYDKTKKWKYNINLIIDNKEINLEFIGTTNGWKIETPYTCWSVPVPKANVKGTIKINNDEINVEGIGYHDHNWGYSPTTAMNNLGWYWGRLTGDKTNITWAKTIESKEKSDLVTVVNIDNKEELYNINPENILFHYSSIKKIKGKQIPTEFKLRINDKDSNKVPIFIDLNMKTLDIQYDRIFTIKYYRYHILASGSIKVGQLAEEFIDKPQIIEFLSFKSKNFV